MTRTERLLKILDKLRTSHSPVSGKQLASELGISLRTLYRDILTLQSQGADIQGEPGIGYVLKSGYFLPPLMFNQDEMEALLLGMLWVTTYADPSLIKASKSALKKISDIVPKDLLRDAGVVPLRVGKDFNDKKFDLSTLREAMRRERKVRLVYFSKRTEKTKEYNISPIAIGYFTEMQILVGWIEEENKFDYFQINQIKTIEMLKDTFQHREMLFRKWNKMELEKSRFGNLKSYM